MSSTCPKFRRQVRGHRCCHQDQHSKSFLKLQTVLHHLGCCTLKMTQKSDFLKLNITVACLFQHTGERTHIQCVRKSHKARDGCIKKEVLCKVSCHLAENTEIAGVVKRFLLLVMVNFWVWPLVIVREKLHSHAGASLFTLKCNS